MGVSIDDARVIADTLPRSYEALVRDRVKFRVGRIVYAAFSATRRSWASASRRKNGRLSSNRSPTSSSCRAPQNCGIGGCASGSTPSIDS